jgi:hypothetical protein
MDANDDNDARTAEPSADDELAQLLGDGVEQDEDRADDEDRAAPARRPASPARRAQPRDSGDDDDDDDDTTDRPTSGVGVGYGRGDGTPPNDGDETMRDDEPGCDGYPPGRDYAWQRRKTLPRRPQAGARVAGDRSEGGQTTPSGGGAKKHGPSSKGAASGGSHSKKKSSSGKKPGDDPLVERCRRIVNTNRDLAKQLGFHGMATKIVAEVSEEQVGIAWIPRPYDHDETTLRAARMDVHIMDGIVFPRKANESHKYALVQQCVRHRTTGAVYQLLEVARDRKAKYARVRTRLLSSSGGVDHFELPASTSDDRSPVLVVSNQYRTFDKASDLEQLEPVGSHYIISGELARDGSTARSPPVIDRMVDVVTALVPERPCGEGCSESVAIATNGVAIGEFSGKGRQKWATSLDFVTADRFETADELDEFLRQSHITTIDTAHAFRYEHQSDDKQPRTDEPHEEHPEKKRKSDKATDRACDVVVAPPKKDAKHVKGEDIHSRRAQPCGKAEDAAPTATAKAKGAPSEKKAAANQAKRTEGAPAATQCEPPRAARGDRVTDDESSQEASPSDARAASSTREGPRRADGPRTASTTAGSRSAPSSACALPGQARMQEMLRSDFLDALAVLVGRASIMVNYCALKADRERAEKARAVLTDMTNEWEST